MSSWFLRRVIRSLGVVIVCGLCTAFLMAEPPGPGKGTKGPPGPPPDAESVTVRGVVKEFTTAPKGEVDGLMLDDDTCVHWPPHMADRFTDIVAKGDKIKVTGFRETGPKGDTKLEVSSLTNWPPTRPVKTRIARWPVLVEQALAGLAMSRNACGNWRIRWTSCRKK